MRTKHATHSLFPHLSIFCYEGTPLMIKSLTTHEYSQQDLFLIQPFHWLYLHIWDAVQKILLWCLWTKKEEAAQLERLKDEKMH